MMKMIVVAFVLALLFACSGCCRLLPDWVAVSEGAECMALETDDCPKARRIDGYCCPEDCICGNECVCAATAAKHGSQSHLNDGMCCPADTQATWVRDEPNMEMYQICQ